MQVSNDNIQRSGLDLADRPSGVRAALSSARRWPLLPICILVSLAVVAAFAPLIAPHDPSAGDPRARTAPPFWYSEWYEQRPKVTTTYMLGADHAGRDVLSRVIHGARISLLVAGVSLASGVLVGTAAGLVSGYFGGLVDEIMMRLVDVWLALPFILIALVTAVVIGQSLTIVMGLLASVSVERFPPEHSRRSPIVERKRLRRIGPRSWGVGHQDHDPAHSAWSFQHCPCNRDVARWPTNPGRGYIELPGRRPPLSHARVGTDDCRGTRLPRNELVDTAVPRRSHLFGSDVSQLPGRLAERPT